MKGNTSAAATESIWFSVAATPGPLGEWGGHQALEFSACMSLRDMVALTANCTARRLIEPCRCYLKHRRQMKSSALWVNVTRTCDTLSLAQARSSSQGAAMGAPLRMLAEQRLCFVKVPTRLPEWKKVGSRGRKKADGWLDLELPVGEKCSWWRLDGYDTWEEAESDSDSEAEPAEPNSTNDGNTEGSSSETESEEAHDYRDY